MSMARVMDATGERLVNDNCSSQAGKLFVAVQAAPRNDLGAPAALDTAGSRCARHGAADLELGFLARFPG